MRILSGDFSGTYQKNHKKTNLVWNVHTIYGILFYVGAHIVRLHGTEETRSEGEYKQFYRLMREV